MAVIEPRKNDLKKYNREHFKLAVQMMIYDINCDDLRDDLNLGCEMDTLTYFRIFLPSVGFELFDEDYDEFKLDEFNEVMRKHSIHL